MRFALLSTLTILSSLFVTQPGFGANPTDRKDTASTSAANPCAAEVVDPTVPHAEAYRAGKKAFVAAVVAETLAAHRAVEELAPEGLDDLDEGIAGLLPAAFGAIASLRDPKDVKAGADAFAAEIARARTDIQPMPRFLALSAGAAFDVDPQAATKWAIAYESQRPRLAHAMGDLMGTAGILFGLASGVDAPTFLKTYEALRLATAPTVPKVVAKIDEGFAEAEGGLFAFGLDEMKALVTAVTTAPDGSRKLVDEALFQLAVLSHVTGRSVGDLAAVYASVWEEAEKRPHTLEFVRSAVVETVVLRGLTPALAYDTVEAIQPAARKKFGGELQEPAFKAALQFSLGGGLTAKESVDLIHALATNEEIGGSEGAVLSAIARASLRLAGSRDRLSLLRVLQNLQPRAS